MTSILACSHAGVYTDRFLQLYWNIMDSNNGYYSKEGIPYHCAENMIIETVDHGHETDSEAVSYNIWLQAMYGMIGNDFEPFNNAWNVMENYMIPQTQYNAEKYNPQLPVGAAGVTVGVDPLFDELRSTYGDDKLHVLHWLLDTDDSFGFGNIQGQCELGPSGSGPSFVLSGPGSVWQGITFPTCDNFKYGGSNGFMWNDNVPSWHYAAAPDADARAIQAAYWASQWAANNGKSWQVADTLSKAAKLGDHLRYSLFDRYFKRVGDCIGGTACPAGTGKESAHYLISWYIAWGGSVDTQNGFAWKTGSSEAHIGYQNPVAAYALINDPNLRPQAASAVEDWQNSLQRQLELYQWIQTSGGLFGGCVTNSWLNQYADPPADVKSYTFHGMFYENEPGNDDGTSDWFGMETWTVDRLAQYYYLTGDNNVKSVLDKWFAWIYQHISINGDSYSVPVMIKWSGSLPTNTQPTITESGQSFFGIGSSIARALSFYAAKSGDSYAKQMAKQLLDVIWTIHKDDKGVGAPTTLYAFTAFNTKVYIPQNGWTGVYPNGDRITTSSSFLDIRSWYKNDPNYGQLETYLNGGPAPQISYHRFWEQADMALALGTYGLLFNE